MRVAVRSCFSRGIAIFIFMLSLCLPCNAFATEPAIRLSVPSEAKVGQTITVKILVEAPVGDAINAVAATLVWPVSMLTPVGEPVLATKIFGDALAARNNTEKGITEILTGSMSSGGKQDATQSYLFAELKFTVKSAGKIKINFTTDKKITANGTQCVQGEIKKAFGTITSALVTAK